MKNGRIAYTETERCLVMEKLCVADYFIEFFIDKGITDVFGYQGGMVAHLFDSLGLYKNKIRFHELSSEQGCAIAACSFSQATGQPAVVITTSGPGFTNAVTGLSNAWFDSIPMILIAGQVNTKDKRRSLKVRQNGFQEIQSHIISESIAKKTYEVDDNTDIVRLLDEAYCIAMEGRKGPVVVDLPINICRNLIDISEMVPGEKKRSDVDGDIDITDCINMLKKSNRPVLIAGAGINQAGGNVREQFKKLVSVMNVPVLTTMPALDLIETCNDCFMGYLGGTARRTSGIVLNNSDLVIALGARLCPKQIGYDFEKFAPGAKLIRVEIDKNELERRIKKDELDYCNDLNNFISALLMTLEDENYNSSNSHKKWLQTCCEIRENLSEYDLTEVNRLLADITDMLPDDCNMTFDVGNNLVYSAQSAVVKKDTRIYISAGLGAMGYAIPASVGACLGRRTTTVAICGDGGAQMNIQELNYISKNKLPIKIIVLNNKALGHIILFQEVYLDNRFVGTREADNDYCSCDFAKIAEAYGIRSVVLNKNSDIEKFRSQLTDSVPTLFEYVYDNCDMLPNIHGGHDYLREGPSLPKEVIDNVVRLLEKDKL